MMPSLPQANAFSFVRCYLCDSLIYAKQSLCPVCLQAIADSEFNLNWQDILLRPDANRMLKVTELNSIYCWYEYQQPFDFLIPKMKYQANPIAKACLKHLIQFNLAELYKQVKDDYDEFVPTPLHWFKYYRRGFNQAQWLAEQLKLNMPQLTDCSRLKYTKQQAKLSGKKRLDNVKNAFSVKANLAGKRILIIDDVVTTGATLDAFAKTLKQAGAVNVSAICLCWAKLT
ncbi:phosphoribosyltransferase family protein [Catenovulum sp. 2E275]|uniref:ComF family protein n=1 Tax=Catenovulum sp. 2E275 TaxID=2980497 RepID=UPI0021CFEAF2|nr:phosphoribosyltransferase family protein [Catenovulum sp. 2E275]MCU4677636.1 phosphoribosyltransferase family protein [Catenovulum sp. 2E275]